MERGVGIHDCVSLEAVRKRPNPLGAAPRARITILPIRCDDCATRPPSECSGKHPNPAQDAADAMLEDIRNGGDAEALIQAFARDWQGKAIVTWF